MLDHMGLNLFCKISFKLAKKVETSSSFTVVISFWILEQTSLKSAMDSRL